MAKTPQRRRPTTKKAAKRKVSRPSSPKSRTRAKPRHVPTQGLYGWITHTELASTDPAATKAWCAAVLGWTFKPSFPTPNGEYHLFAYSHKGAAVCARIIRQKFPAAFHTSTSPMHEPPLRRRCARGLKRCCLRNGSWKA